MPTTCLAFNYITLLFKLHLEEDMPCSPFFYMNLLLFCEPAIALPEVNILPPFIWEVDLY